MVRLCAEARVPIIPFGTGTSLEGQVNAPFGGVSLDLSYMNRILTVHAEDFDCVVEPGVTRKALNEHLRDLGLFFSIDPGADASLGGMAATRASGTNAVRYGTMRDNVLSLTAVMADGTLLKTGNRARKSASGYDLTRLLVGSEGTLGIITELTLKLHGIPDTILSARLSLRHHRGRLQRHHRRHADGTSARPHRARRRGADQGVQCLFASDDRRSADAVSRIPRHGGRARASRSRPSPRLRQTRGRGVPLGRAPGGAQQALAGAPRRLLGGARAASWRRCRHHRCLRADLGACRLRRRDPCRYRGNRPARPIVGHVGDGNFHVMPLFDASNAEERRKVQAFLDRLVERALRMDGTCSGEHGVGQGKIRYLAQEHGAGVDVMIAIKKALDPLNILNPGKIFALP